jgi:hypothetical protein
MVYRGHIENGNVVLDDHAPLAEGTRVEIHVVSPASNSENAAARHWLEFSGAIDDLPSDASQRVDEILYGRPDE